MFKKILSLSVIVSFFLTSLGPIPQAHADTVLGLPAPGTMVNLSPAYAPVMIKGLTVHKDNPFLFDFIVDVGQDKMSGEPLKKEGEKLIKYFLASLAIPDKDVWVNLSPYEKSRIIPDALGQTDMGRDLLEQDYILKQITASLIYPEKQLGKTFWDTVYSKAQQMYGTTQIPVNTFNKVWITADRAEVFEHNQTAFVVDSHLKVMLEEDYLALQKHTVNNSSHSITSNIVRQIILPELEKEVNTGKNFANLRQIFNSIILSSWYKRNLKEALLNQVYADKSKVKGVIVSGAKQSQEEIYDQYLKAYKKGVFNYIKEDVNAANGQSIPRQYFSGGMMIMPGKKLIVGKNIAKFLIMATTVTAFVTMFTGFDSHSTVLNASSLSNDQIASAGSSSGYNFIWNSSVKEAHEQTDAAMSVGHFLLDLIEVAGVAGLIWGGAAWFNSHFSYTDNNQYKIKLVYLKNETLQSFDPRKKYGTSRFSKKMADVHFANAKGITVKAAYSITSDLVYLDVYAGNTISEERRAESQSDESMISQADVSDLDAPLVSFDTLDKILVGSWYGMEDRDNSDKYKLLPGEILVRRHAIKMRKTGTVIGFELDIYRIEQEGRFLKLLGKFPWSIPGVFKNNFGIYESPLGEINIVRVDILAGQRQSLSILNVQGNSFRLARFNSYSPDPRLDINFHTPVKSIDHKMSDWIIKPNSLKIDATHGTWTAQLLNGAEVTRKFEGDTAMTALPAATQDEGVWREILKYAAEQYGLDPESQESLGNILWNGTDNVARDALRIKFNQGGYESWSVILLLWQRAKNFSLFLAKGINFSKPKEQVWNRYEKLMLDSIKNDQLKYVPAHMDKWNEFQEIKDYDLKKFLLEPDIQQATEESGPAIMTRQSLFGEISNYADEAKAFLDERRRQMFTRGSGTDYVWIVNLASTTILGDFFREENDKVAFEQAIKRGIRFETKKDPKIALTVLRFIYQYPADTLLSPDYDNKKGDVRTGVDQYLYNYLATGADVKEGLDKVFGLNGQTLEVIDNFLADLKKLYAKISGVGQVAEKIHFDVGEIVPHHIRPVHIRYKRIEEKSDTPKPLKFMIEVFRNDHSGHPTEALMGHFLITTKVMGLNQGDAEAAAKRLSDALNHIPAEEYYNGTGQRMYDDDSILDFLRKKAQELDVAMKVQVDRAVVAKLPTDLTPGGIDLNTSNGMQWKVSKDGRGVEMNVDSAMIARIQRDGIDSLSPVIFKITPVANVWSLVGLQAPAVQ